MVCLSCGRPERNIGGIGSQAEYVCENTNCPSHFIDILCPICKGVDKKVTTRGIGDQVFSCKKCGNVYTLEEVE